MNRQVAHPDLPAGPGADPSLLSRYLIELRHLRQGAAEFARDHPKVAARLGLDGEDEAQPCADPHVERLLEGFAFLAARVHHQIDAAYPRFTRHLLERLLPHHAAPTPSIAVVALEPDLDDPSLAAGPVVPAGSVVVAGPSSPRQAPCRFRSGHAVRLWPLRVAGMSWRTAGGHALCLQLSVTAGLRSDQIALDALDLHLAGDEAAAHALHALLCERVTHIEVADGRATETVGDTLPRTALEPLGMQPAEALLPTRPDAADGLRLLKEYAACPARLLFLRLSGLAPALQRLKTPRVDLRFHVDRHDPDVLRMPDAVQCELHATPLVNLHVRRADRLVLDPDDAEHRVIVDRMRPDDHEIHSIRSVTGFDRSGLRAMQSFVPLHERIDIGGAAPGGADGPAGYAWRRAPRRVRRGTGRLDDTGLTRGRADEALAGEGSLCHDVWLSLCMPAGASRIADLAQLAVEAWCSDHDRPRHLPPGDSTGWRLDGEAPVRRVRVLHAPTAPLAPVADGEASWALIGHLGAGLRGLVGVDEGAAATAGPSDGAARLREFLVAVVPDPRSALAHQVDGLVSFTARASTCRLPTPGPSVFARGLSLTLTVDESRFAGVGPVPLARVISRLLAERAVAGTFVQLTLVSTTRGVVHCGRPLFHGNAPP